MNVRAAALCLLLAASNAWAARGAPAGKAVPPDPALTEQEFLQGTQRLRRHLSARGEDPAVVEEFVGAIEKDVLGRVQLGKPFPVERDAFESFLKYEAAWARKTRDAKNPKVTPDALAREKRRSTQLKEEFLARAKKDSRVLLAAYRDAVKKARAALASQHAGDQSSAGAFDDQVDDSYTQVDAGDEALDQGDTSGAVADANAALAENPGNADAFTLKAGAEYAAGDTQAAVADAQQALALDPNNAQASAIVDLAGGAVSGGTAAATLPDGSSALLAQAGAVAGRLAADGAAAAGARAGDQPAAAVPALSLAGPAAAVSATPALGARLSADLTAQAARSASLDAGAAARQLGRALALDPRNGEALDWVASLANRGGDYKTALSAAEQAVAVNPQDAHGWFAKGQALAGEGADDAALASLREAARLDPAYRQAEEAFSDATAAKAAATAAGAAPNASYGSSVSGPEPVIVDPWLAAQTAGFARRPHRRKTRWPKIPPAAVLAAGALLLVFGVATAFRSHREA